MARIRHLLVVLLAVLGGWQIAAANGTPRACMVLQVQGSAKGILENKESQLKTLQVLSENTTVTVAADAKLRLTYFKNGRKEVVSGPCSLTIGLAQSKKIAGSGRVAVENSSGAKTLVPESENLRRMGGALHAMVDLGPQRILDMMPNGPVSNEDPLPGRSPVVMAAIIGDKSPNSSARNVEVAPARAQEPASKHRRNVTRSAPRATFLMLAPTMAQMQQGDLVRWVGPQSTYCLTILDSDENVVMKSDAIETQHWSLPKTLKPGQTYTLGLQREGEKNRVDRSFYIWTDSELALIEKQFSQLGDPQSPSSWDEFVSQIAFLEARGLLNEALPIAREANKMYPDDAGLTLALGRIQFQLGLEAEAERTLERAVLLESRQPAQ